MVALANRCVETTQTTGTGTVDLLGAQDGSQAFADDLTSGEQTPYVIEDDPSAPTEWEVGIGTWTDGSPATLARDTVIASSNNGNKISLQSGQTYVVTGTIVRQAFGDAAFIDAQSSPSDTTAGKAVLTESLGDITAAVMPFAMSTAPSGWLKCNGAAVSRTTYARLFAKVGTTWGAGDGTTTFGIPDARGEFLRGWDDGRGVDSGRDFASAQGGQNEQHNHASGSISGSAGNATISGAFGIRRSEAGGLSETTSNYSGAFSEGGTGVGDQARIETGSSLDEPRLINFSNTHNHSVTISGSTANSGGDEARPRNIALLYCIKY